MPLLWMVVIGASAPSAEALVAKIQQTYREAGAIEARFEQVFTDALRGKPRTERGQLWAAADGKLRWSYTAPQRKDFVFDGKNAYFYEPENAQVTVFERFEDSPLSHALRFLIGKGNLSQRFEVTLCRKACPPTAPGHVALRLAPRRTLPGVERIFLGVEEATGKVAQSVVVDPLQNQTVYRFEGVVFGAAIAPHRFAFRIPRGAQVLRATHEGLKKD